MRNTLNKLTDPITIGKLKLKNRLIMAPMKSRLATEEGFVTPLLIDYYMVRARAEVALIIVEASYVSDSAKSPADLGIASDKFISGLKDLVEAIHKGGAKAAIQIYHPGRRSHRWLTGVAPVAPSSIRESPLWEEPRQLNKAEISDIIGLFADAAVRAAEAGFDAVEFHGAHAYLPTQFFSPLSNQRRDEYGGTLENRMRFALEMVDRTRASVGPSLPLFYRFPAWERGKGGITLEDAKIFAKTLERHTINCLNVSTGSGGSYPIPSMSMNRGTYVPLASEIKKVVQIPVAGVGRINNPFLAEEIIRENKADLVTLGRPLTADPEFMRKYLDGRASDIRVCLGCNTCTGKRLRPETATYRYVYQCLCNPELGNERALAITTASVKKTILIAGAGPAGMEAARVAAIRGHHVMLCEKDEELGGQIRLAATPPFRREFIQLITYYAYQLSKLKVDVRPNTKVTPELLRYIRPDVVIVANGSHFVVPDIKGVQQNFVCTAADILAGKLRPKGRIAVVGKGQYALETAEYVAWRNCAVTVLADSKELGTDLDAPTRGLVLERLAKDYEGLKIICGTKVKEILTHELVYTEGCRETRLGNIDIVVLAIALAADKELFNTLQPIATEIGAQIFAVGDCQKPRRAIGAIHSAFFLSREL